MAEILGLTASIIATIQITESVIKICKGLIKDIRDAPSDFRAILIETTSVAAVLQTLEFVIDVEEPDSNLRKALEGSSTSGKGSGPIQECHCIIVQLAKLLPAGHNPEESQDSKGKRFQAVKRSLAWPLDASKAKKLLQDLGRCKDTVSFALTATSMYVTIKSYQKLRVFNVRNDVKRIQQVLTGRFRLRLEDALSLIHIKLILLKLENQRNEVHKWLKHTDPSNIHRDACKNHEPGTCEWILRVPEWAQYEQGDIRCLWIHGMPGAGKTILASQLANKIEKSCAQSNLNGTVSIGINYYCHFGRNQDESAPFLQWVLDRMCKKVKQVPDILWDMFEDGGEPDPSDLLNAVEAVSHYFSSVFIMIDAVDESSPRDELLSVLRDLATDHRFAKIRLLVASREYLDIERVMREISTEVSMRNAELDADIRLYTKNRLTVNKSLRTWPEDLRAEALEALTIGAKGMFRWVDCQLDALRRIKEDKTAVRKELKNLPKDINKAYNRIFEMMPEEDRQVVASFLDWICFNYKVFKQEAIGCGVLLEATENYLDRQDSFTRDYRFDVELLKKCAVVSSLSGQWKATTALQEEKSKSSCLITLSWNATLGLRAGILLLEGFRSPVEEISIMRPKYHEQAPGQSWRLEFQTYCAISAIKLISANEEAILKHEELATLLTTPHQSRLHPVDVARRLDRKYYDLAEYLIEKYDVDMTFWLVQPSISSPQEVRILLDLLHMGAFNLVDFMLSRVHDAKTLFQTMIEIDYVFPDQERGPRHFHVSLISFIATISARDPSPLRHLLKTWSQTFDCRIALLNYVMWHHHEKKNGGKNAPCSDWCTLQELLSLGAEPDSLEFIITPLQIAVACLDLEGVKVLLKCGAQPNAAGNPGVMDRPEHFVLRQFDFLSGMTPLKICDSGFQDACLRKAWFEYGFDDGIMNTRLGQGSSGQIRAVLCEYGAT
ncbi:hypothetical protein Landi51_03152 [Colletotrichum acutatum]